VGGGRRLPLETQKHEVLFGECLAGALYNEDFKRLAREVGFTDPRWLQVCPPHPHCVSPTLCLPHPHCVSPTLCLPHTVSPSHCVSPTLCLPHTVSPSPPLQASPIDVRDAELKAVCGEARFYSITYRLFKLPGLLETLCEDYGQYAVYKGTIPGSETAYWLDDHHRCVHMHSLCVPRLRVSALFMRACADGTLWPLSGLVCSPETGQSCYVFTHPAAVSMTRTHLFPRLLHMNISRAWPDAKRDRWVTLGPGSRRASRRWCAATRRPCWVSRACAGCASTSTWSATVLCTTASTATSRARPAAP
jgi:hypothetical protein